MSTSQSSAFTAQLFDLFGVHSLTKLLCQFIKRLFLMLLHLDSLLYERNKHAARAETAAFRHASYFFGDLCWKGDALPNDLFIDCHEVSMDQCCASRDVEKYDPSVLCACSDRL